jgi:hypothetical protein
MHSFKLPVVGEKLWSKRNGIAEEVEVKEVTYKDTRNSRTIEVKTNKGIIDLFDLCDTEYEARRRLEIDLEMQK